MLRQPLLQPATLLARTGARATAQGAQLLISAHVWRQVWARPPITGVRTLMTTLPKKSPVPSAPTSPFFRTRPAPRRTFHSSRTRRSQDGSNKTGQEKTGPSAESGSGSSSAAAEPLSLSARLKKLSREYGWTAVGVYFGLSLLDFPFCFLLVRTLGTDRIAAAEEFVVSHVQAVIPASVKDYWHKYRAELLAAKKERASAGGAGAAEAAAEVAAESAETTGWGVAEAEERNRRAASLATQLALAYAIHKSFIFIRVPLTAAVTPKVVRVLRAWGWKIGKQNPAV